MRGWLAIKLISVSNRIYTLQEGGSEGVDYQVSVSYLELYLEDLRDLLDASTNSRDITIREDDQGNTGMYLRGHVVF